MNLLKLQFHVKSVIIIKGINPFLGDISIFGEPTLTVDSITITLTCISTGGIATTVSWTKDSTPVTEGAETVLNDTVTAQYTHTLTVTRGGSYTCTVANNKPSSDSAIIHVVGNSKMHSLSMAVSFTTL